jgi:Ion channel
MRVEGRSGARDEVAARPGYRIRWLDQLARSTDSYGLVMILIFLDYIATSALSSDAWGRVITVVLLGTTLVITLHTSRAHRGLMLLGWISLVANTIGAVISALLPLDARYSLLGPAIGGFLLVLAPVVIVRRIVTHNVVTVETILGAIDVYLLFGMIFALAFAGIDIFSSGPFFVGEPHATASDYLFFSYSTLTTVGYGNLVPAGKLGQALAMVEALSGQIYLVILVARLVSLWGQARPKRQNPSPDRTES